MGQDDFSRGCLFDGFPRTVAQAEFLGDYLATKGQRIHRVIHLQVPESQLVTRLMERSRLEGVLTTTKMGLLSGWKSTENVQDQSSITIENVSLLRTLMARVTRRRSIRKLSLT